ncbi:pilus assembly protein TadG-related protein [Embleya sp. NPDC059237]|uniref:pilus assembly protein TadG-related protein n=1 Tax=Embleya sp. NPDC059237 TaxID=3346784 RepID=UPI0036BED930
MKPARGVLARLRVRARGADPSGDAGRITAFVAALIAGLMLCAGLVLDGGLALAAKTDALDAAQEAARSGAQALDLAAARGTGPAVVDAARGRQAALDSLAAAGYRGTVTVAGARVTVHVTHRQRTQILTLAGVSEITVTATASAEAQRGVLTKNDSRPGGTP